MNGVVMRKISWEEVIAPLKSELSDQKQRARNGDLVNCIFHNEFIITDPQKNGHVTVLDVSFNDWGLKLTNQEKIYIRKTLIGLLDGYKNEDQVIRFRAKSARDILRFCKNLFIYANTIKKLNLASWDEGDLSSFLKWYLVNPDSGSVRSLGAMQQDRSILNKLNDIHRNQSVGLNVRFSRTQLVNILEPTVRNYGLNFVEWKKGSSHNTVPLEVAVIMLGYALDYVEQRDVFFVQALFKTFKKRDTHKFKWFIDAIRQREKCTKYKNTYSELNATLEIIFKNFNKIAPKSQKVQSVDEIESFIKKYKFPLTRPLTTVIDHIYESCYAIMVILTGFRIHEIRNMKGDCLEVDRNGTRWLETVIDKTSAGFTKRVVSEPVEKVVDLLNVLSWVDKSQQFQFDFIDQAGKRQEIDFQPSLFSRFYSTKSSFGFTTKEGKQSASDKYSYMNFTEHTAKKWLNNVWEGASKGIAPELKLKLEEKTSSITSHAFRHTWVEYALLNFQGNVLQGISRNFGYSQQDMFRFLQNYIVGKYGDANKQDAERQAASVLVTKLFGEVVNNAKESGSSDVHGLIPDQFKGPMATKLALYIKEKVHDIRLVTPDEVHDLVDELMDEGFMRLSPHQYGYCLLFGEGRQKAACIDSKFDIQKSKNGEFSLCMKCPNMLVYMPVNGKYLQQTLVTHKSILAYAETSNSPFNLGSDKPAIEASRIAVEMIERVLENPEVPV
jgi:integrase